MRHLQQKNWNNISCAFIFSIAIFLHEISFCQTPNPVPVAFPTTSTYNYTRIWTATAPDASASHLITRALTDVKQSTQYYDGFGRPIEVVTMQASPAGNDMIEAHNYDATTGNEIYKYLPFTSNVATSGDLTNDGNFKLDMFQQQVAFYNTYLSGQTNETNVGANGANWAYGQTNFEASPLLRVLNTFAPGTGWVGSQGTSNQHNSQQEFLVNTNSTTTNDQVPIWNITVWSINSAESNILPTYAGSNYGPGMLYKTITIDEQGHQIITYKNLYDQVLLKKVQLTASADNGTTGSLYTGWLCTFYVYDDHGFLRFVITPDVVAQMVAAGSWAVSQSQADELCYRYEYDQLGHMIVKKAPGTPTGTQGEVWMVYDERNRPVLQQDGNMRLKQKWAYFQYDNLDRLVAKGFITDPTNYNNLSYHVTNAASSGNNSSNLSAWPVIANYTSEILTQTFYDSYASIPASLPQTIDLGTNGSGNTSAFTTSYNVTPNYAQSITQSPMIQGLVTGGNVEILGLNFTAGSQFLPTVNFYDEKGRVIQTQALNYSGGKDIATVQYSWSGEALSTLRYDNYVSSVNPQSHWVITSNTYDAMGRIATVTKTVNSTINGVALTAPSTNPTTIATYQYDELGRMKNRQLGNSLDNLAYGYNVRGWLLNINQAYISGSSSSNYFGLELGYDKTNSLASGNSYLYPSFNGNISGSVWKSKGDGINRKYDLSYDNSNRLSAAAYLQNSASTTWDNSYLDFSVSIPSYDANGNIQTMNENGFAQGGKLPIDQLTYHYVNGTGNSNRVDYVSDAVNVTNSTLGDFYSPGTPASGDYAYDNNANTIGDKNRTITSLVYYLNPNLPQTITTAKGTITYYYDANGNKLRKQVVQNGVTIPSILVNNVILTNQTTNITTTTTYVNDFVYKTVYYSLAALAPLNNPNTDVLQFIGVEEGRLRFKPALGTVVASFVHDYFERDHLGNIRIGITDEAQQDIYPAATGETTTVAGGVAQTYEALFYNFNPSDFITTASLGAWYTNMSGSASILNENNSGVPVNNDPYSATSSQSQRVFQLCGNTANNPTGDRFGLGITLKVMAGDNVNILGTSFWHNIGNLPTGSYPVSSVIANLLGSFAGSAAVTSTLSHSVLDGSVLNSTATGPTATLLSPLLNNSSSQSGTQAPYAGINYIIFDDQFRPVTVGFYPVSINTDVITPYNQNVPIAKNGYIFVYVSNQSNINVYFDNLQVVQTRGPLLEEAHYYPSGLLMAGISDRAWNKLPNYYHYQGKELQDQEWYDGSGLEEYDFSARYYDQQIGRWNTQDPAGQYASPYVGMGNNWLNSIDPDGKKSFWSWFKNLVESPWTGLKITVGGLFAWNNQQSFGQNLMNIFSRMTWQAPQEVLGMAAGVSYASLGEVDKVSYFNGLTIVTNPYLKPDNAYTLGNITNSGTNIEANANNSLLQHEYGRYLQSQANGPTYISYTALHDLLSSDNSGSNANLGPTARDANTRALEYFVKYYGTSISTNWDNTPGSGNYISGFNPALPFGDPANQEALRNNTRNPGFWNGVQSILSLTFMPY